MTSYSSEIFLTSSLVCAWRNTPSMMLAVPGCATPQFHSVCQLHPWSVLWQGSWLGKILKAGVNSKLFHDCGLHGGGLGGFLMEKIFLNPNIASLISMASLTINLLFRKGMYFEKQYVKDLKTWKNCKLFCLSPSMSNGLVS